MSAFVYPEKFPGLSRLLPRDDDREAAGAASLAPADGMLFGPWVCLHCGATHKPTVLSCDCRHDDE